jgi:hypothetical protein
MRKRIDMTVIIFTCLCLIISSLTIFSADNNNKDENVFTFRPVYENNYFIKEHNKLSLSKKSSSQNNLWIKSNENILSVNENSDYINTNEIDISNIKSIYEKQKRKSENILKNTVLHLYHLLI